MKKQFDVDFVVTWVDSSDKNWIESFNKYVSDDKKIDASSERYNENGLLKYWFRCVAANAPWVRKIHFITCGQKPEWLNESCEKLNLVNHKDYISSTYLPVFNSRVIENSINRINDLSEYFVLFNDDFFLINKTEISDFFSEKGMVKDCAFLYPFPLERWAHTLINNESAIRKHINIDDAIRLNKAKWFSIKYGKRLLINLYLYKYRKCMGIRFSHFAQPYRKSLFDECWNVFKDELEYTMTTKFRSDDTVNHYLFRDYNIMKGDFIPKDVFRENCYRSIEDDVDQTCQQIISGKYKQLVINDRIVPDLAQRYEKIKKAFEIKFPDKCMFEK